MERSRLIGLRLGVWVLCWAAVLPGQAANDLYLQSVDELACISPGATVTVALRAAQLSQLINGVQVLVQFDDGRLALGQILPGDGVASPWNVGLGIPDISGGHITYSIALLGTSTDDDAVVARFVFTVLNDGLSEVAFRPSEPPLYNKLTAYPSGETITPQLHGPVTVVSAEPGDGNGDGVVNLADYAEFEACLGGPGQTAVASVRASATGFVARSLDSRVGPSSEVDGAESRSNRAADSTPPCPCYDFDVDGDVDLVDFAYLQRVLLSG